MKIGLNGQMLTRPNIAGPEQFAINLYKNICKLDKVTSYTLYLENAPTSELLDHFKDINNLEYKVLTKHISWTQISLFKELITNKVDVYFTPFHTLPLLVPFFIKTVAMIHGFEYKVNKEYKTKPLHKLIHPLLLGWIILTAKAVIVPSKRVYDQINFSKKKVHIIPEAVGPEFHKRPASEIELIKSKYNIKGKYLFFLSTIQPRKNLPKTILAMKDIQDITLVVAGKLGWEYEESVKTIEENKNKVLYIGRIPDEDRPALYSGADSYINCSLDEGFGLPLLEAIACETKAVVSDIPAFKETAEEYATYVNPQDVNSIKEGIIETLKEPNASTRAREIAAKYSWTQTANRFIQIFRA